jgi:hypothetical protein
MDGGIQRRPMGLAVRFWEGSPADLARARTGVPGWQDQNPAGTGDELVAAISRQFHRDHGVVLRAVLFAVDRHRAHGVTGYLPAERGRP